MKYRQLDRIVSITPGREIVATRTLRADEEYLRDHFPRFPVMPGVMMLEALTQAAMWLVRVTDDFRHPLVLVSQVRSVKFGDFLAPDQTLDITATVVKQDGPATTLKASAQKDGRVTVSARLTLRRQTILGDFVPSDSDTPVASDPSGDRGMCRSDDFRSVEDSDAQVARAVRDQFESLFGPVPLSA